MSVCRIISTTNFRISRRRLAFGGKPMPNPKSQQQYVFVCLCYCLVLVGCMQQSWGDISQFKTQRTLSSTDITHDSTKDVKCRIGKNLQSFRSMHLFLHRCVVVCDGQLIAYRLSTQSVKSKSSCVVAVFFFFFFFQSPPPQKHCQGMACRCAHH